MKIISSHDTNQLTMTVTYVNIGGDPNDPCYRYKREVIKIEKVNKGLWCIANINNICKQLKVKDKFLNTFYGEIKRRGVPMIGKGQFKGMISNAELEKIMNVLIDKLILCPKCKLPEWNGEWCAACGNQVVSRKKSTHRNDDDDDTVDCTHMHDAVQRVHHLYDLRDSSTDEKRLEIEEIIDHFWDLEDCENNGIKDTTCAKKYATFCRQYDEWIKLE